MTHSATRLAAIAVVMVVAVALPTSLAGAGQSGHTPTVDPGTAAAVSRAGLGVGDSGLRVAELQQLLASFGYTVVVDGNYGTQTARAVRHFQRSNHLTADAVAGPATMTALHAATPVTGSVPAVRVTPKAPQSPAPSGGDACAEMSGYRQAAGLPEQFDAIGYRESRCRNDVTSSTGCCFGWLQNFLSSHLSNQSAYRDRIINECGVTKVADIRGNSDAQKRGQMCVTFVVYSISGLAPWRLP